jgi:small subunit ribosomal protein S1
MLSENTAVTATVSGITPYGAYLSCQGERIFILATELSWHKEGNDTPHLVIGEDVNVMILGYNDDKKLYVGSIKRLQPDANPYRTIAKSPTDIHRGRVLNVHQNGLSIAVGDCFGNLPYDDVSKSLVVGQDVLVTVEAIDPDKEYLEVRLSIPSDGDPPESHS